MIPYSTKTRKKTHQKRLEKPHEKCAEKRAKKVPRRTPPVGQRRRQAAPALGRTPPVAHRRPRAAALPPRIFSLREKTRRSPAPPENLSAGARRTLPPHPPRIPIAEGSAREVGKWDSWGVRGQGPPRPCTRVSQILGGCGGGRGQRPLPSEVTLAAARPLGALPREASAGSAGGNLIKCVSKNHICLEKLS